MKINITSEMCREAYTGKIYNLKKKKQNTASMGQANCLTEVQLENC